MARDYTAEPLVSGVNCYVRIGNSASDAINNRIGYVDSFRATKNLQLQDANVVGEYEPVSIDVTGIRVTLSMSGFLAAKEVYDGSRALPGMGTVSLSSFNPKSEDFKSASVVTKFPYMDFYDEQSGSILASFNNVISESYGISGNAGAYVKIDSSMRAITMSGGDDYTKTLNH